MIEPALLARVPGWQHGPPHCLRLGGGSGSNDVLRITTHEGQFVLRRRRDTFRPGADALHELAAHRAAAAAGLAPRLIDCAEDGRWLLMEYVTGAPWTDASFDSISHIETLGSRLRALHALPLQRDACAFDPRNIAAGQVRLLTHAGSHRLDAAQRLQQEVERHARQLAGYGTAAVLNHGDLHASNVLGGRALLIDWEYAQWADPLWDIACLLTYYPKLEGSLDLLLATAGLDDLQSRERLPVARALFQGLDALWRLVAGMRQGHGQTPA